MRLKRVVITGVGAVSPFGLGADTLYSALIEGRSCIRPITELQSVTGLRCHIAGKAPDPEALGVAQIPRKFRRSMSAMSVFSYLACKEALEEAGVDAATAASGNLGLAIGSTLGSTQATQAFYADYLQDFSIERTKSQMFFKVMSHTCAANAAQALGIRGRVIAPAAACASGGQAIGLGFEAIAMGRQDMMLCGGADELHPLSVATFDILNVASARFNDAPEKSPRPFDTGRDGTVCSEGAGVLLLESLDSALQRGATPIAEMRGFAVVNDAANISTPDAASIESCMRKALDQAEVPAAAVNYVNAHATATELGDIAEGQAIERVVGAQTPVSCCKGNLGHALAASGGLESAAIMRMYKHGRIPGTHNLVDVDPRCGNLHHVTSPLEHEPGYVVKNNFALGGVNTCLVFGRYVDG